ncbi:MAG: hypothetical protein ABWX94_03530 [Candidatus Saccharimonadales bacterium]
MPELSPQSTQVQEAILQNLPHWVQQSELKIPDMVRSDDRLRVQNGEVLQKPPKDIDKYSFVPMRRIPQAEDPKARKDFYGGYSYDLDENVDTHFDGLTAKRIPLDGPFALGIVKEHNGKRILCAVGSATIEDDGKTVVIPQIQGAISDGEVGPQLGGFNWAETLVKGIQTIAAYAGATALKIPDASTHVPVWMRRLAESEDARPGDKQRIAAYHKRYDQTPQKMGMKKDPGSNTYKIPIKPRAVPPVTPVTAPDGRVHAGGEASIGAIRNKVIQWEQDVIHNPNGYRACLLAARYYLDDAIGILAGENFISDEQSAAAQKAIAHFEKVVDNINVLLRKLSNINAMTSKYHSSL